MRVLLQRVTQATVTAHTKPNALHSEAADRPNNTHHQSIAHGLVLLTGIADDDTEALADRMADKIANLRIFNDDEGKFNRSLLDVAGGVLIVSQFTLFANARKGRRPSFTGAGKPDHAAPLCDYFAQSFRNLGVDPVAAGVFGAHMQVEIHNQGPVTLWLDSKQLF